MRTSPLKFLEMAMEKNEGRQYRFRINTMKKTIIVIIILFFCNYILSQEKIDTIKISQNNIKLLVEYKDSDNPRIGKFEKKYFVDTITNKPLNGIYKVILDENNFYITNFENGFKFFFKTPYQNIVKYYTNNVFIGIDYYSHVFFGREKYISIPNYNCKSGIFMEGFIKEYSTSTVINKISIYQKIKKKSIYWKIYYPDKTIGEISFNKTLVNLCK